jgi:KDO2-lipid IV(A) lauroyltransferase
MDRNRVLYLLLRCASFLVPFLPLTVAYALAAATGRLAFHLVPGARRSICENLSVVLSESADSRRVRRAAITAFQNDARNWIDTLRIGHLRRDDILKAVTVDGWHHLDGALAAGKGAVLVTLHLGNFDLVGQVLVARGLEVMVPVEHMRPPELFDFLVRQRVSQGINLVPVERAPRAMIRALQAGQVVALAGDRNSVGRVEWVDFFGRPAPLPRGPVSLARHTGAPLLIGFGVRVQGSQYQGFVTPPLDLVTSSDVAATDHENTQRLAHAFEPHIKRYADQWLVFTPMWPQTVPVGSERSMALESEAAV